MFWVYAIKNQNDKIYIGQTSNLEERLKRHNGLLKNKSKSYTSKNRGEWKLIYSESKDTRQGTIEREKELKSAKGREFIRNLLNN